MKEKESDLPQFGIRVLAVVDDGSLRHRGAKFVPHHLSLSAMRLIPHMHPAGPHVLEHC